ncbi:hypothetical protein IV494_01950 [Kaistella sp. G5-32]|uniref:Uncharacterized protein n=1 Tax=Kaistella gelatinilytica TaxID=2787636 RepID=A0ABS0F899_9FLAO|nr:hypothetical protein [Kaistella gelatinilytica]MBF8455931.1 hypothetical protein [Kaistella gelatinilytica]
MKLTTNNKTAKLPKSFYTGIKSLIGGINLLSNKQILKEKDKLNNMRNGKVRA